jgi:hypothetical protein
MREANFKLLSNVSWLNALMYLICGTSFTVLKIIYWFFFGKDEFAVVSANVLCVLDCRLENMSLSGLSMIVYIKAKVVVVTYLVMGGEGGV